MTRFKNSRMIPHQMLEKKQWITGRVTAVGDGDNFRLYHTPGGVLYSLFGSVPTSRKDLKDETLHIRIAGVDAPERAHFGKPAQPYGDEALHWLRQYLLDHKVRVQLLDIDRYGRVVGQVTVRKGLFKRHVGLEMIKAGFADVYDQAGAQYGDQEQQLRNALQEAKRKKKGMWKDDKIELPSEYKRRTKQ
ncbi:hypothetical protein EDD86DRAFT_197061 [Gorgonomyces haynaldii]|nr:hypothetical protein EDD86DRAFT_197061 [Gorgonomyces haynaldii]